MTIQAYEAEQLLEMAAAENKELRSKLATSEKDCDEQTEEILELRSRLEKVSLALGEMSEALVRSEGRLGEHTTLLAEIVAYFDVLDNPMSIVPQWPTDWIRRAKPIVVETRPPDPPGVPAMLKLLDVEKPTTNLCDEHTCQRMTYLGNGAWKCDACGATV